jgi:hypothetical protein
MEKGNATQRGRWVCKLLNDYNAIFISVARIAAHLPPSKVSAKLSLTTLLALAICSPVSRRSQWLTEFRDTIMPNSWSEDDMGRLKDHLRKHPLDSSTTSYADLLEISNDDLAYLANECVAKNDAPTIWFMTALIGILKRLKPHENPNSYRLMGLESCFLKGLMVLIHWRT